MRCSRSRRFQAAESSLKDIRSIAISVRLGTDMRLDISSDLGQEQASTQVAALLQTLVVPMLSGMLAESSDKKPMAIGDQISVSVEATVLNLGITFTGEELIAYQKKMAEKNSTVLSQQH